MLIPRYIFTNDFVELKPLFEAQPHKEIQLNTGDFLWQPDEHVQYINYIESGIARTYLVHESGRRKIISYHGSGTISPVFTNWNLKLNKPW